MVAGGGVEGRGARRASAYKNRSHLSGPLEVRRARPGRRRAWLGGQRASAGREARRSSTASSPDRRATLQPAGTSDAW